MDNPREAILVGLFLLAIVVGAAFYGIAQYDECIDLGMTHFYCIKHVL